MLGMRSGFTTCLSDGVGGVVYSSFSISRPPAHFSPQKSLGDFAITLLQPYDREPCNCGEWRLEKCCIIKLDETVMTSGYVFHTALI